MKKTSAMIVDYYERNKDTYRYSATRIIADRIRRNTSDGKLEDLHTPVFVFSVIESLVRASICDLVDNNPPILREEGQFFNSHLKSIKAEDLFYISASGISAGQLISHQIQFSRLEQVLAVMSKITKSDFPKLLKEVEDPFHKNDGSQPAIIHDSDETFATISETFEYRNIVCHEWAGASLVCQLTSEEMLAHCYQFCDAFDVVTSRIIDPDIESTQSGMNIRSSGLLKKAREDLNAVFDEVKALIEDSEAGRSILHTQTVWEKYLEAELKSTETRCAGGTIMPLQKNSVGESLIRERIRWLEMLKEELEI